MIATERLASFHCFNPSPREEDDEYANDSVNVNERLLQWGLGLSTEERHLNQQ